MKEKKERKEGAAKKAEEHYPLGAAKKAEEHYYIIYQRVVMPRMLEYATKQTKQKLFYLAVRHAWHDVATAVLSILMVGFMRACVSSHGGR